MSHYLPYRNGQHHKIMYMGLAYAIPQEIVVYNNPIYVDGSVAITGDGSQGAPYKTIQEAADVAVPGDTVVIAGGIYYEHITPANSGTSGSPITYVMETAPDGSPMVHIIGGETVASWTNDPALGYAVYKNTGIAYDPKTLTVDGTKRVPKLVWGAGTSTSPSTGQERDMFDYIGLASDFQWQLHWNDGGGGGGANAPIINFWDGLGGAFGYDAGVLYVKFADGTDPNTLDIRIAAEGSCGFDLTDKSYIVIRGGKISGGDIGVLLSGPTCHDNTIEDCEILTGATRVKLEDRCYDNIVRNNEIYQGRLDASFTPGAWSHGNYNVLVNDQNVAQGIYEFHKYLGSKISYSSSDCGGVQIRTAGAGNEIYNNTIYDCLTEIDFWDTNNLKIYGNTLYNSSSGHIVQNDESLDVEIYDNLFYNGNFTIRSQDNDDGTVKRIYAYRNRSWNPDKRGSTQIYIHFQNTTNDYSANLEWWIYHNSFAGEQRPFASKNLISMSNMHVINNVLSSNANVLDTGSNLGLFAHNWCGGFFYDNPYAPWWDASNINDKYAEIWTDATVMPDFQLPASHVAREAGVDVSAPFTIDGTQYPALPGFNLGYFSGSAPHMGYHQ